MMTKNYTLKEQGDGKYLANITIPADIFKKSYDEVLKSESEKLEIKGFRKGKVPTGSVESALKNDITETTLSKILPIYLLQMIYEEKINIVMPPVYKEIPKVLLGTDIKYEVELYTIPSFSICEPKKIKIKRESAEATADEEKTGLQGIKDMLKESKVEIKAKEDTDEWVKEIAKFYKIDTLKTMDDLKKFVKTELEKKKKDIIEKNYQNAVLAEAIKRSKIKIHEEIIKYEAHTREHSLLSQLKNANMTLESWLEQNKLSHEDLHKALEDDARLAIEQDAFLAKYAEHEKIEVDEEGFTLFKNMVKGGQQVNETEEWVANLKNVYIKQKAYGQFLAEVDEANGVKQPKTDKSQSTEKANENSSKNSSESSEEKK